MTVRIGEKLTKNLNGGYSLGLEYPYIYGRRRGRLLIWNRHTGEIIYIHPSDDIPCIAEYNTGNMCYKLNGLSIGLDAATRHAIDDTP